MEPIYITDTEIDIMLPLKLTDGMPETTSFNITTMQASHEAKSLRDKMPTKLNEREDFSRFPKDKYIRILVDYYLLKVESKN